MSVKQDELNQNVIQADCLRTRFLSPQAKQQMVPILTYYVKHEQFTYKQGINELLLPFMWLESKRVTDLKMKTQADVNLDMPSVYR